MKSLNCLRYSRQTIVFWSLKTHHKLVRNELLIFRELNIPGRGRKWKPHIPHFCQRKCTVASTNMGSRCDRHHTPPHQCINRNDDAASRDQDQCDNPSASDRHTWIIPSISVEGSQLRP